MASKKKCAGHIQLVFFDDATDETVTLGGAGFLTKEEDDAAWANIPIFSGESRFMADRMDADLSIVDNKIVSAETCERLTGKPIAQLIADGRAINKAIYQGNKMASKKLSFSVKHPGEIDAGISGYTDTVTVDIESGDAGGDKGEFEEYMRDCLAEWFDGAAVRLDETPDQQEGVEQ